MVTGLDCASATPLAYDVWQSHNHYVTPWMDDPAYMCVVGLFCRVSSSVSSGFVVVGFVVFRRRRFRRFSSSSLGQAVAGGRGVESKGRASRSGDASRRVVRACARTQPLKQANGHSYLSACFAWLPEQNLFGIILRAGLLPRARPRVESLTTSRNAPDVFF
jgi:hypothetical protein